MRQTAFRLILPLLLLAGWLALPARGEEEYVCDDACTTLLYDWVIADVERFVPFNRQPTPQFDSGAATEACTVKRDEKPQVHAAVFAPSYPQFEDSGSGINSARVVESFLLDRGVRPDLLRVETGESVTRDRMHEVLAQSLACVRERDQVVLVLIGNGSSYDRWVAPSFANFPSYLCAEEKKTEAAEAFCAAAERELPDEASSIAETVYRNALADHDEMLFFSSEVKIDNNKAASTRRCG